MYCVYLLQKGLSSYRDDSENVLCVLLLVYVQCFKSLVVEL